MLVARGIAVPVKAWLAFGNPAAKTNVKMDDTLIVAGVPCF